MSNTYETIQIAKTQAACGLCEEFAAREAGKPIVVMACEGACLRGELARLTANHLCDELAPERTARLCLGGAFTKDTGQRGLVRNAPRVIAVEGCPILCATRMMQGVLPELKPEVHQIPALVRFDSKLFAAREMPEPERKRLSREAAEAILAQI
jgi:uncharacterized metal-binding protein